MILCVEICFHFFSFPSSAFLLTWNSLSVALWKRGEPSDYMFIPFFLSSSRSIFSISCASFHALSSFFFKISLSGKASAFALAISHKSIASKFANCKILNCVIFFSPFTLHL